MLMCVNAFYSGSGQELTKKMAMICHIIKQSYDNFSREISPPVFYDLYRRAGAYGSKCSEKRCGIAR